jgi:uncharacterized protein (TIGR02117 family)
LQLLSLKWLKRTIIFLGLIVTSYLAAALLGSLIAANSDWQQPSDGIELFVETNGVHTGIVMPVYSNIYDWRDLIKPSDLRDPSQYGSHILVGWGHAGVYRNAEKWQNLRFSDASSAIFGSDDTLVHVYHLNYPQTYPHYRRRLMVSESQYRIIASTIAAQIKIDSYGQPSPSSGYGQGDLFYDATGHYNAFNTCNSWTASVLRKAGIRTAAWTPFSGGVMRWIPN